MYKRKRTSKVLYLLFVVLLTAVVINKISQSKKGETNFKSELMEFAAEDVVSLDRPSFWSRVKDGLSILFASKIATVGLFIILFWVFVGLFAHF